MPMSISFLCQASTFGEIMLLKTKPCETLAFDSCGRREINLVLSSESNSCLLFLLAAGEGGGRVDDGGW